MDLASQMHHMFMKTAFLFFLLSPTLLFCQKINSTQKGTKSNIYNDAIKHYLIDLNHGKLYKSTDTIFIEKNENFGDSLLKKIRGCTIKVLEFSETGIKAEKEGSFTLHKFFPLKYEEGLFYVLVIPFRTTITSDGVNLGNGGGCKMYYRFDSRSKEFTFVKVNCWGI